MNIVFGNKVFGIHVFDLLMCNARDYINFFVFDINGSFVGDHSPRLSLIWIMFNLKIIEIELYDIRHKEVENDD